MRRGKKYWRVWMQWGFSLVDSTPKCITLLACRIRGLLRALPRSATLVCIHARWYQTVKKGVPGWVGRIRISTTSPTLTQRRQQHIQRSVGARLNDHIHSAVVQRYWVSRASGLGSRKLTRPIATLWLPPSSP